MGGEGGDMFEYFKILILQGLVAARKHQEQFVNLIDIMRAGILDNALIWKLNPYWGRGVLGFRAKMFVR